MSWLSVWNMDSLGSILCSAGVSVCLSITTDSLKNRMRTSWKTCDHSSRTDHPPGTCRSKLYLSFFSLLSSFSIKYWVINKSCLVVQNNLAGVSGLLSGSSHTGSSSLCGWHWSNYIKLLTVLFNQIRPLGELMNSSLSLFHLFPAKLPVSLLPFQPEKCILPFLY